MSAAATPRFLIAPITWFIFAAFADRAAVALEPSAETPKVKSAVVGVVSTMPVPCTVIVLGAAVASGAATAASAAASTKHHRKPDITLLIPALPVLGSFLRSSQTFLRVRMEDALTVPRVSPTFARHIEQYDKRLPWTP